MSHEHKHNAPHGHDHSHGAAHEHDIEALDGSIFGDDQPCFGCSPSNPFGMKLKPVREGRAVTVRYTAPPEFQGPAGVMHGGLVTTLADELAGWVVIAVRKQFGFTGAITARLLKPVRIGVEVQGRATIVSENARTLKIDVRLHQSGEEMYRGMFSFVVLDEAGTEKVMGMRLPEAWRRFARAKVE
jgi:acyl-coenzyme A thioesterase PaaI-like protein